MHPLILVALLCAQPDETLVLVKLDAITPKDVQRLEGKAVVATFTVGKPVRARVSCLPQPLRGANWQLRQPVLRRLSITHNIRQERWAFGVT